jgi:hypothetical protein
MVVRSILLVMHVILMDILTGRRLGHDVVNIVNSRTFFSLRTEIDPQVQ